MIRFLAEIAIRSSANIYPTPSMRYSRENNIYELDMNIPPEETYWTEWGGWYDEYVGEKIELYYGTFLQQVSSEEQLLQTPFSVWINDNFAYINIPKHPWLYPHYSYEGENVIPFLSSAIDPGNPSINIIYGINAQVRIGVPSFTVKLSDNISGITLNQDFSIDFINNDGFFDDSDKWNLFNTPVHLKKSIVENPSYEDFKEIRGGYAENTKTTFDRFTIFVSDKLRNMGEPLCDVIQQKDFPELSLSADAIGKNIPVIYGQKKVRLIKLDLNNHYIGSEYASAVTAYDKDGNVVPATIAAGNRIITTVSEADSALITGYANNKIGEIIKDIISRKTSIRYNDSTWNVEEVENYVSISTQVNICITTGDVKNAVQSVLKSDIAYFIQQADGRFTLRKYGSTYGEHTIPSWILTQKPEKDFEKSKNNYFSSCKIKYGFTEVDKNTFKEYFFDDMKSSAEDVYRKKHYTEYDTDLIYETDARALAQLIGTRYTVIRENIKVGVGMDTTNMKLLDTVSLDLTVNGRQFTKNNRFIITEINPAQDILTLEGI